MPPTTSTAGWIIFRSSKRRTLADSSDNDAIWPQFVIFTKHPYGHVRPAAPHFRHPQAPLILQQAQAILNDENRKRQAFYEWLDEDKNSGRRPAEFINGEVVVHSPALDRHNSAMLFLVTLLSCYVDDHRLGNVRIGGTLIELTRNSYEPDVCYFKPAKAALISDDQLYYPAPDFIAEVLSKSTEKNDREIKFADYAAHAVAEYWIIDPMRRTIEQYGIDADTAEQ